MSHGFFIENSNLGAGRSRPRALGHFVPNGLHKSLIGSRSVRCRFNPDELKPSQHVNRHSAFSDTCEPRGIIEESQQAGEVATVRHVAPVS